MLVLWFKYFGSVFSFQFKAVPVSRAGRLADSSKGTLVSGIVSWGYPFKKLTGPPFQRFAKGPLFRSLAGTPFRSLEKGPPFRGEHKEGPRIGVFPIKYLPCAQKNLLDWKNEQYVGMVRRTHALESSGNLISGTKIYQRTREDHSTRAGAHFQNPLISLW